MELRHLRYFLAVSEDLSVTRAAARLGIAQPALSHQIQALEREIGAPLLFRQSRGVSLTEAGRRFADGARRILADVAEATTEARRSARGEVGRIRIGFTGSASFNPFVTGAIRDYRAAYPDIEIELVEENTAQQLEAFRARRLDVAFVRPSPGEFDGFWTRHLFDEPMVVALPVGHPLAGAGRTALAALADESFITYPRRNGRALYDSIAAACEAAGFQPRIWQNAPQLTSVVNLVATGIAIAIVPASMARVATEGVRYLAITGPAPSATMVLARPLAPEMPAARMFADLVVARLPAAPRDDTAELRRHGGSGTGLR